MSSSTQRIRAHVAACMLLGAGMIGDVHSAIVHSGTVNIPIPNNIDGIYLNMVTGATGATGTSTPGWDFNAYSSPTDAFRLFGSTTANNAYLSTGGTINGPYRLALGTLIGASGATFFRPNGTYNVAPELILNSADNLIGVSLQNEIVGGINFGWLRVQVGATTGVRSIVEYAYQTTIGTPIAAGETGIGIFASGFESAP